MDTFLTELYEEAQEKRASAELQDFMKSMDRDDLEAFLGLDKQAVAGPAEGEMPANWQGKELDASQKAKDDYLAQEHQGTPKSVEKTDKWAQTCNSQEGTSKVKSDKEDEPKTKAAEAKFQAADAIGRMFAKQASLGSYLGAKRSDKKREKEKKSQGLGSDMAAMDSGLENTAEAKIARIFGAGEPSETMYSDRVPYDVRERAFKGYLQQKSQEAPTGLARALGGGAAVGGGLGALLGAGTGGGKGALIGSGIGAGLGALGGAGMRAADKSEIARTKQELASGDLPLAMAHRIGDYESSRNFAEEMRRQQADSKTDRRHREHMDVLRGRGSTKKAEAKAKIAQMAMKVSEGAPEHVKAAAVFMAGRKMAELSK
jgi:hypothetical protein